MSLIGNVFGPKPPQGGGSTPPPSEEAEPTGTPPATSDEGTAAAGGGSPSQGQGSGAGQTAATGSGYRPGAVTSGGAGKGVSGATVEAEPDGTVKDIDFYRRAALKVQDDAAMASILATLRNEDTALTLLGGKSADAAGDSPRSGPLVSRLYLAEGGQEASA